MNTRKQQGFTIIEVVLVLAIAGLIFLMVFIALPALNRGQRDTQRRNDVSRFKSQIVQYQANNKGKVPATFASATAANTFITNYLNNEWTDPSGSPYAFVTTTTSLTTAGQWTYAASNVCDGENFTTTGAGARNFAIRMKLEGAGVYCADNN